MAIHNFYGWEPASRTCPPDESKLTSPWPVHITICDPIMPMECLTHLVVARRGMQQAHIWRDRGCCDVSTMVLGDFLCWVEP